MTKETKIRYVFLVGLTEDALCQHPSDSELRRISVQFDPSVMYELAIHLGTTIKEWKIIRYDHPESIEDVMFLVLWKWKETTKETFRELAQAVVCVQDNTHKLCMVSSVELEGLISPIYLFLFQILKSLGHIKCIKPEWNGTLFTLRKNISERLN